MKKDPLVFIDDILEAIDCIQSYIQGITQHEFFYGESLDETMMRQDAVIRRIEIIGEASNNLSELIKKSYPNIPWGDIIGMRNRIVHKYFEVDLNVTWDVCTNRLEPLKKQMLQIKKDLEK